MTTITTQTNAVPSAWDAIAIEFHNAWVDFDRAGAVVDRAPADRAPTAQEWQSLDDAETRLDVAAAAVREYRPRSVLELAEKAQLLIFDPSEDGGSLRIVAQDAERLALRNAEADALTMGRPDVGAELDTWTHAEERATALSEAGQFPDGTDALITRALAAYRRSLILRSLEAASAPERASRPARESMAADLAVIARVSGAG